MSEPQTTFLLDSYRFLWLEDGIDILLDRLHEDRDGLKCEMTITSSRPPRPGLLREGNFNISSTTTRAAWVKDLSARTLNSGTGDNLDWYAMLELVCARARRRWREGDPLVDLADVQVPEELPYLLHPLVVEGATSVLFADGGSGKSLVALAIAVSVASGIEIIPGMPPMRSGPVIYWDWEWNKESHAERLEAICAGAGIELPRGMLFYQHEVTSAIEAAPRMRRRVAETGAVFAVADSLGFARGGDANSQELTIRMFSAFNSLSVPVLAIDHVSKNGEDKSPTHSFGSAYTYNAARIMWRLDAAKEEGRTDFSAALVNTKTNRKYQRTRGLNIMVATDEDERLMSVSFAQTDVREIPGLNKTVPLRELIRGVIEANRGFTLEYRDIADALRAEGLQVKDEIVRVTLYRNRRTFVNVSGKWGILAEENDRMRQ